MVGAHLDSVTAGPGINDNGSGSAAILETAIQMAKVKPRNKVRFAWWSAEESGLVGSTRYVASLSQAELDKIALYLNFDMVGSPNFVRFVYDGDNSTGAGAVGPGRLGRDRAVFDGYFESQGLAAEPTPFNGRSDYGPFIAAGHPGRRPVHRRRGRQDGRAGGEVRRHGRHRVRPVLPRGVRHVRQQLERPALDPDVRRHRAPVITLAQSTEAVNGIRGKGNFKRPAQGDNDGTGTGGGGGLHDEHEHDEA